MTFAELIEKVPDHGVFTTGQILSGERRPADLRRQLDRWVKSGKVKQLRRGVYALNNTYAKKSVHPFLVANLLKKASCVSLQSALAHYGMIPEYVPVTTSVTTRRPEELTTPIGRFQFRHLSQSLFNGFTEVEVAPEQYALLATPYKALVDLLYLTPRSDDEAYLEELRIARPAEFSDAELSRTAEKSGSRKVMRAVSRLVHLWESFK